LNVVEVVIKVRKYFGIFEGCDGWLLREDGWRKMFIVY